jgi:hypothetical protein
MPRRSTGSRNTPARQARLQKLTKGTTDTISSLRKAMGFTPKRPTGSRRTTPTPVATPVATPSNPSRGGRGGRNTPAQRVRHKLAALRVREESHLRLRKGYKQGRPRRKQVAVWAITWAPLRLLPALRHRCVLLHKSRCCPDWRKRAV